MKYRTRIIIILSLLLVNACGQTPSGRAQLALVPPAIMENLGQQAFAEMKQSASLSTDPRHDELVQCIADHIIESAASIYPEAMAGGDWEVVVFDNDIPNAFALPGQKIGVHTGLIRIADNPDQLAAVIGHEVGHVLSNHGNERMTQQLGVTIVLLAIGILGEIDSVMLMRVLGLGAQVGVILPFSRAHESEADLMGLKMMAAAGFDPEQSVALWQNMAATGSSQPHEFLSTHPGHETRIRDLKIGIADVIHQFERVGKTDCQSG